MKWFTETLWPRLGPEERQTFDSGGGERHSIIDNGQFKQLDKQPSWYRFIRFHNYSISETITILNSFPKSEPFISIVHLDC